MTPIIRVTTAPVVEVMRAPVVEVMSTFFELSSGRLRKKRGELANLLKSEDESAATFKGNKRLFNEKDNDVDLKEAQDRADAIKKLTREIKAYKSVLRDMRDEARNDR